MCSGGNAERCQMHVVTVAEGPRSLSIGAEDKRKECDGVGDREVFVEALR